MLSPLPAGVRAGSLAQILAGDRGALEPHLARHEDFQHEAFSALNTAFLTDGAFVSVPRGVLVEKPIHLLYRHGGGRGAGGHPPADPGGDRGGEPGVRGGGLCLAGRGRPSLQRGHRGRGGRRKRRRAPSDPAREPAGVSHLDPAQPAGPGQQRHVAHVPPGGGPHAPQHSPRPGGRGGRVPDQRPVHGQRPAAHGQLHEGRARQPALREPAGLQGHPGRSGARGVSRPDHRAQGRPEDRRQADQHEPAPLRGRPDRHQAATRDLRRRREMHPRRHRRADRRRGHLLSALPRYPRGLGPGAPAACLCGGHAPAR